MVIKKGGELTNSLRTDVVSDLREKGSRASKETLECKALGVSGCVLATVNKRQVVSLNQSFIDQIKIESSSISLTLKIGKIIQHIHATNVITPHDKKECNSTCEVIMPITALSISKTPQSYLCSLKISLNGVEEDRCFDIQTIPFEIQESTYHVISLRDITSIQCNASLKNILINDISHVISGLSSTSELMLIRHDTDHLARSINRLANRLKCELKLQQIMDSREPIMYVPDIRKIRLSTLFQELQFSYLSNPKSNYCTLYISDLYTQTCIYSDYTLLFKALTHLTNNAFDASHEGGIIKLSIHQNANDISFLIWNPESIPERIQHKIFQRYFSTNDELGRGVGLYTVKLIIEKLLGGQIDLRSTKKTGTQFEIRLPQNRLTEQDRRDTH